MTDNSDKKRRFLLGTTVLLASLTCSMSVTPANAASTSAVSPLETQTPKAEFVLAPASGGGLQTFQHESHSSHASHASHASHSSHSSHYSYAG
jgi:hypothetical protein